MKVFYTIEFSFRSYHDDHCKPHFQYDEYDDALEMYNKIIQAENDDVVNEWLKEEFEKRGSYGYINYRHIIQIVKTTVIKEVVL